MHTRLLDDELFQQTAYSLFWSQNQKVLQILRTGAEREGFDSEHELWPFIKSIVERFRRANFVQFYHDNQHLLRRPLQQMGFKPMRYDLAMGYKPLRYELSDWDKSTKSTTLLSNGIAIIHGTCQQSHLPHDLLEEITGALEDELVESQEEYKYSFRSPITNETFELLFNNFCGAGDLDILILCMCMGEQEGIEKVFHSARVAYWKSLEKREGRSYSKEMNFSFQWEPAYDLTYTRILKGLREIDHVIDSENRSTLPDMWQHMLFGVRHAAIRQLI